MKSLSEAIDTLKRAGLKLDDAFSFAERINGYMPREVHLDRLLADTVRYHIEEKRNRRQITFQRVKDPKKLKYTYASINYRNSKRDRFQEDYVPESALKSVFSLYEWTLNILQNEYFGA